MKLSWFKAGLLRRLHKESHSIRKSVFIWSFSEQPWFRLFSYLLKFLSVWFYSPPQKKLYNKFRFAHDPHPLENSEQEHIYLQDGFHKSKKGSFTWASYMRICAPHVPPGRSTRDEWSMVAVPVKSHVLHGPSRPSATILQFGLKRWSISYAAVCKRY